MKIPQGVGAIATNHYNKKSTNPINVCNVRGPLTNDYFRRMEFSEQHKYRINGETNVRNCILFTDETRFDTNGTENPYAIQ